MNKFKTKNALFKANNPEANSLNITAKGDFVESSKIVFNIEAINNPLFDVKNITVELVDDKIIIITERENKLSGTEGVSLFLKKWYISEYDYYLKNCLVNYFVTAESSIKSEIKVLSDREPYQFLFKFPKNVIEDSSVKSFVLTIESDEFFLEYEKTDGKEIFGIIDSQIKSFIDDLMQKIQDINKHKG